MSAASLGLSFIATGQLFGNSASDAGGRALLFALLAGIFAFGELSYGGRAARAEERRLRQKILTAHFEARSQPTPETEEANPGHVIQMMTDNVERLTEYKQVYFGATLAAFAIPFVTLAFIGIAIDPVIGFVVMALIPAIPLLIGLFMRLFRATSAESRKERTRLSSRYLDAIRNLVVIRLLGAGERIEADLVTQGERNRRAIMKILAGNQLVIIIMDGLFGLVLICLTAGLTIFRADHLDSGQMLTVMLLSVLLLEPLQQVAGFFYIGMSGMAAQRTIRAYLTEVQGDLPSSPAGSETSSDQSTAVAQLEPDHVVDFSAPNPELGIELRGVSFDYGRGIVLSNLNLTVPRGQRVAIMGRSGAGKSTMLALLRGSITPQHGFVAVAGQRLDSIDPRQGRALSATVAQTTWMFTGTIADNLRFARDDATDADLWIALEQAHIAEEVAALTDGLDTYLGEGAALISGGQAQRISLARALLSQRQVLLLDEPTSHVDLESEASIIDAITALPKDRTVLIVTHRASLLACVDRAYELVDGQLMEMEVARG